MWEESPHMTAKACLLVLGKDAGVSQQTLSLSSCLSASASCPHTTLHFFFSPIHISQRGQTFFPVSEDFSAPQPETSARAVAQELKRYFLSHVTHASTPFSYFGVFRPFIPSPPTPGAVMFPGPHAYLRRRIPSSPPTLFQSCCHTHAWRIPSLAPPTF